MGHFWEKCINTVTSMCKRKNLEVRLLKNCGELGSGSIFFFQTVERVQDLCDQLNIVVPHGL